MRELLELPKLSLGERDRRWGAIRAMMKEKGLDCLLLCGFPCKWDYTLANARFVTHIGGNAAFNFVVFPCEGEPTCFILMPTFLEYWKRAQDWVKDVRAKKGSWAETVASRIKELKLAKSTIGVDGLAGPLDPDGWFPHSTYAQLRDLLPAAEFVNLDDMLEKMRAVKSPEEIEFLKKAARLGDLMLEACRLTAGPGVRESEVYGKMMDAMISNGGEEPTLFLWAADAHPLPHPFRLPTMRPLEKGDIIICEMHPKYGGYFTHVERTFSLGEPERQYRKIYEGCLKAYARGMELFMPGAKITGAMEAVRETIKGEGLGICEAGIHGHGLSSQEYPRFRTHAAPGADAAALKSMEDEFRPGMVFCFNIDLVDPQWKAGETGTVFAETILVTEEGPRRMHAFPMDFQVIE
jgi:Xaa-Pro dipeptidase